MSVRPVPLGGVVAAESAAEPHRRVIAAVIAAGSASSILTSTVVSVAVPDLQRVFGASLSEVQWVLSAYLLGLSAVIPISGWVGDRLGSKQAYLLTLGLFGVASLLCGLASSIGMEIALRVIQGMAGGMIVPIGMTILLRITPARERARTISLLGVPLMLAPAIGPTIGGWLVQDFDWRLIFWVNLPLVAGALIASALYMPAGRRVAPGRLDWVGLLLASPGVATLTYGITSGPSSGWSSPRVTVPILTGTALIAAFVVWSLRRTHPLLDMRVFRDRGFAASSVVGVIIAGGLFGVSFLIPSYLQQVEGYSPGGAGLVMGAQGIGAALALPFSGALADRYGPRRVVFAGVLTLVAASLWISTITSGTPAWQWVTMLAVRGAGMGFGMMPAWAAAYSTLAPSAVSRATATANTIQRVSSSFGVALLATVLQSRLGAHLPHAAITPAGGRPLLAHAVARSYDDMLLLSAAITLLALPASLLLQRPLREGEVPAALDRRTRSAAIALATAVLVAFAVAAGRALTSP